MMIPPVHQRVNRQDDRPTFRIRLLRLSEDAQVDGDIHPVPVFDDFAELLHNSRGVELFDRFHKVDALSKLDGQDWRGEENREGDWVDYNKSRKCLEELQKSAVFE